MAAQRYCRVSSLYPRIYRLPGKALELTYFPAGTRAGFGYPHRYNVNDAAVRTELAKKQYEKVCQRGDEIYEFPITRGVYKSGPVDQIADRILLRKVKKGQYNYCLLITHLVSIYVCPPI